MQLSSNLLFKVYNRLVNSIAFYPAIIVAGFMALSLLVMIAEYTGWAESLRDPLALVLVKNEENARLILGTLVGGVISLTVFSFSMVMVVLNQAASTLSPRVIPGLVTQPRHQQILGFYVGTIIFALLLMVNVGNGDAPGDTPELGVLLAIGFGVLCLVFFVYFIHSISRAIQIDTIVQSIYGVTLGELLRRKDKLASFQRPLSWPDDRNWSGVRADRSGYFKNINAKQLANLLRRHGLRATVPITKGAFVLPGQIILRLEREIEPRAQNELRGCFLFYVEEYTEEHYFFGFKQLSEIAVKALSPGINDPGTAVKAIEMLSVLFIHYLELPDFDLDRDGDGKVRLYQKELTLAELLYHIMTPLRTYGGKDPVVMLSLLEAMRNILYGCPPDYRRQTLLEHVRSLIQAIDGQVSNSLDRDALDSVISRINRLLEPSQRVPFLN